MRKEEFLAIFEEILELDPGTITGKELLGEFEDWSSLAVVSLIALIDEKVGITMEPERIQESQSVEELMGILGDIIEE
jgi:acyl carrier protein